jgi:hypothetical protein
MEMTTKLKTKTIIIEPLSQFTSAEFFMFIFFINQK